MKTILVVEDNEEIMEIASEMLKEHGFHILKASNGKMALDLIVQSIEKKEKLDLIISDMHMPVKTGLELSMELKSKNIILPFILISADSILKFDEIKSKTIISDVQVKPFNESSLFKSIHNLLKINLK